MTNALTAIERAARDAWHAWGNGYAMFTRCSRCKRFEHCRGVRRATMLCLECFDETH